MEGVREDGKAAGYLRWILGVDRRTPRYMIREEFQRGLIKSRVEQRAWRFEKRLEKEEGLQGNVLKKLRIEREIRMRYLGGRGRG